MSGFKTTDMVAPTVVNNPNAAKQTTMKHYPEFSTSGKIMQGRKPTTAYNAKNKNHEK